MSRVHARLKEAMTEGLNIGSLLENEATSALTQSLEVVHRFSAPGSVLLSCADFKAVGDGEVLSEDLKLIAIRGSSLSNTFLGGQPCYETIVT